MHVMRMIPIALGILLLVPCSGAWAQQDEEIARAVEAELQQDQAVPYNDIEVTVADGAVSLTGSVPHLLASDRAAQIAATVRGVALVDNNLEIDPGQEYGDQSIAARIRSSLQRNPATEAYEIDVEVDDGLVRLDGTVESFQEAELAEKVALGVKGVKGLVNEIDIVYEDERTDAEIRSDIRQALRMNVLVDGDLIDVAVDNGVVTLSGKVGSLAEKDFAIANAWVLGVDGVKSGALQVDPSIDRKKLRGSKFKEIADSDIAEGIRSALILNPVVDVENVNVSVDDGAVTLRGTVESLFARREAAEEARLTVGVLRVRNHLRVRSDGSVADRQIEEQVRAALNDDPWVEQYEIVVDAINGTVFLSGTVDSYYEKSRAGLSAAAVTGVEKVDNNLAVGDGGDLLAYDPYLDDDYYYDYAWYRIDPALTFLSDEQIEEQINDQLFWSPFVDADEVRVSVEDGVATLTGKVDSWAEKSAAYENAIEGGATWVRDGMTVD